MASRVRVYLACSLDGFIAGEGHSLDWLAPPEGAAVDDGEPSGLDFESFLAEVGALLMGRTTHDVIAGMDVGWPYGPRPVLVATSRALEPAAPTVRPVSGDIHSLVARGLSAAGGRDLYLDGGALVRSALEAGLVDELVLTLLPIALGRGVPLFQGLVDRRRFTFGPPQTLSGGLVQLHLTPVASERRGTDRILR